MLLGHGAFSFHHGEFCRRTGKGCVPAARAVKLPIVFVVKKCDYVPT
jgi:hypothetical protein